ncbi:MAG: hypothetical protein M5T61_10010 [Acidimicrobiia bacterium]|nr:hypothetical protein [Acidimicrobiia bacterium]
MRSNEPRDRSAASRTIDHYECCAREGQQVEQEERRVWLESEYCETQTHNHLPKLGRDEEMSSIHGIGEAASWERRGRRRAARVATASPPIAKGDPVSA